MRTNVRRARWFRLAVGAAGVGSAVLHGTAPADAQAEGAVSIATFIDDRPGENSGSNNAIALGRAPSAAVAITVENGTDEDLVVQGVRLEGTAFGVAFLSYTTALPVTIEPGAVETIGFDLPLDDIVDQAVGLIPASIELVGAGGTVAEQDFTVEVLGTSQSLFGTLGLAVGAITVMWMLLNLWLLSQRRLPPNRFLRGLRFGVVGIGAGLTIVIALAAYRVVAPYPSLWRPLVLLPGIALFLLGFVSPGVLRIEEDEVDLALRQRASRT